MDPGLRRDDDWGDVASAVESVAGRGERDGAVAAVDARRLAAGDRVEAELSRASLIV